MNLSVRNQGLLQILLSGFCFALLGTFAKVGHQRQIEVLSLLGIRFVFAGFLLLVFCLIFGKIHLSWKNVTKAVLMGLMGYASFSYFYFKSLGGMAAGTAVVILFLYPLFVYLLELVQSKSLPSFKMSFVLLFCLAGVFLLVNGEFQITDSRSFIYGLTASFLYGIYVFLSAKYATDLEPFFSTCVIQISAGLCLCILSQAQPVQLFEIFKINWDLFLGLSFVSSILPMTLFLLAAQKLSSFELSVLNVTEPLFGILFSAVLLNEKLTITQATGAFIILLVSIYVSQLTPKQPMTSAKANPAP